MAHRSGCLLHPTEDGTEITAYYDWTRVAAEPRPRYAVIGSHAIGAILERTRRRARQEL